MDVSYCGNILDYDMSPLDDDVHDQEIISFGIVGFDDLGQALLTIFQILTMEGWSGIMYNYMDVYSFNASIILYFCFMILFGSFFVMNLILAAIMDNFDKQDKQKDIEEEMAHGDSLKHSRLQSQLEFSKDKMLRKGRTESILLKDHKLTIKEPSSMKISVENP